MIEDLLLRIFSKRLNLNIQWTNRKNYIREVTGFSLRESKAYVDRLSEEL